MQDMSDIEFHNKPGPARWSAAEVVEHLCILEDRIPNVVIRRALSGPRYEEIDESKDTLPEIVRARETRVEAPPFVQPQDIPKTAAEGLAKFAVLRGNTIAFVQSSEDDLRRYKAEHPLFGPMDAYVWLRNLAAHTERHVKQIEECKLAL